MKAIEVFFIFLRLGFTSFGGPVAHLGYFHDEFVEKRKWISPHAYADLVALCQFLPGPASSQVGMALGFHRAGYAGAFTAWLGFTLPSASLLVAFALGAVHFQDHLLAPFYVGILKGLKIAAVAIVAQAIYVMATKLSLRKLGAGLTAVAAFSVFYFGSSWTSICLLILGGFVGAAFLSEPESLPHVPWQKNVSPKQGLLVLTIFSLIFLALPLVVQSWPIPALSQFSSFFRAGSLVFGGGHVVLPLLESEVVQRGWVSSDIFMNGYAAAQAIPGPLFSFSAYLGALSSFGWHGVSGGALCLVAIFLPSYLLIIGILPFWEKLRSVSKIQSAMQGMNAIVVGLLITAFIHPVWTSSIHHWKDMILACISFYFLIFWKRPSWQVILFCILSGWLVF